MTRKFFLTMILLLTAGVVSGWAASSQFDHWAHVDAFLEGEDCSYCHKPDAESIVPPTKVCLDCHDKAMVDDVALGATQTHGPNWPLNHGSFAKSGAQDAQDCSVCHAQDDCLECHASGFADEMGNFSNKMINVHRSDFLVSHPIAARTDQQLCASCHESRFCSDCHDEWRFETGDIGSPSHRRTFELGFENADFEDIHGAIGKIGPGDASLLCDQCHLQTSVAPDFHSWSIGHAREARRSLATCQACHPEGDVCLTCHMSSVSRNGLGINPHGDDWDDIHDNLNDASDGRTCRKCH